MAKEESFWGKCGNFVKSIFTNICAFFAFIFSPITKLWKKEDVEEKKKEDKPVDKPKQMRKEARMYELNSYFSQKNATQQRKNRTKKANIFQSPQQDYYGTPTHFDRPTTKQQPNSDFENPFHPDTRDVDVDDQDDQDDSNSTVFNNNNNDYKHSSSPRSRFPRNQQQNYANNNYNRQDQKPRHNYNRQNQQELHIRDQRPRNNHEQRSNYNGNNQSNNHHKPLSKEDKKRQEIGRETMQAVTTGSYKFFNQITKKSEICDIKEKVDYCIYHTKTIKPNQSLQIDDSNSMNSRICKIDVTLETSFEALRRIKTDKKDRIRETCILNFASATQPGGGFLNGRNAQEETLSRQSALYYSLTQESEMYDYNKMINNPYYSDYMIYSPNVPFFRDDNYQFIEPFTASVITSPAVNYAEIMKNGNNSNDVEKIYHVMKNRCERIIKLCINKGNKALILGAFGCGVFKNPPEMISQIFKELLVDEGLGKYLKYVVFPIASDKGTKSYTYNEFKKTFEQY